MYTYIHILHNVYKLGNTFVTSISGQCLDHDTRIRNKYGPFENYNAFYITCIFSFCTSVEKYNKSNSSAP